MDFSLSMTGVISFRRATKFHSCFKPLTHKTNWYKMSKKGDNQEFV